jgi:hypothetical protein
MWRVPRRKCLQLICHPVGGRASNNHEATMGRSIPVTLGRFTFRTQSAARGMLRAIRDASPDYEPILDEDAIVRLRMACRNAVMDQKLAFKDHTDLPVVRLRRASRRV